MAGCTVARTRVPAAVLPVTIRDFMGRRFAGVGSLSSGLVFKGLRFADADRHPAEVLQHFSCPIR
jgi:hypothetical protein